MEAPLPPEGQHPRSHRHVPTSSPLRHHSPCRPPVRAQDDAARRLAEKLTADGATAFANRQVDTLMSTYESTAHITAYLRDNEGGIKEQSYNSYETIRALYNDLFKDEGPIEAHNTVDYAKFIGADLLLISGTFEVTKDGKTQQLPFTQLRHKVGENWRILHLDLLLMLP